MGPVTREQAIQILEATEALLESLRGINPYLVSPQAKELLSEEAGEMLVVIGAESSGFVIGIPAMLAANAIQALALVGIKFIPFIGSEQGKAAAASYGANYLGTYEDVMSTINQAVKLLLASGPPIASEDAYIAPPPKATLQTLFTIVGLSILVASLILLAPKPRR